MSSDWLNSEMLYINDTHETKTTQTDSNSETTENVI
jgi:hypothetical protein